MDRKLLFYGDNLEVLRRDIKSQSIDLIYLDPPFNSNRSYNVLFKSHAGDESAAQIEAFDDSWHWSQQAQQQYEDIIAGGAPVTVAEAIEAMHDLLGQNDLLAYLVMMTARIVEMHRVLKPTGNLFLHCDPTASHYLKIILDAVFDPRNFKSEIIWKRYGSHNDAKKNLAAVHDVILFYSVSAQSTFNQEYIEHDPDYVAKSYKAEDDDGRKFQSQNLASPNPRPNLTYAYTALNGVTYQPHPNGWKYTLERMKGLDKEGRILYPSKSSGRLSLKNYLDEMKGSPLSDLWTDIKGLTSSNAERLGYPTQKPVELLKRIIQIGSNVGDVVLDPFCGCGTTIDAAQELDRFWIGIDITYLAVDLIQKRLRHTYGDDISKKYEVHGIPTDVPGALALFDENPFEFERWSVSLVDGTPNEKQVGDKGIDGRIRFYETEKNIGSIIVSVKGGKTVNPSMVRDLVGTLEHNKAEMALLILNTTPTKGMIEVCDHSGLWQHPTTGRKFPKVQMITVAELLSGKKPELPQTILPYIKAKSKPLPSRTLF